MTEQTPQGSLTEAQVEIMDLIWANPVGLSAAQIWQSLNEASDKDLARTTVQTMVTRLQKRGWLHCDMSNGVKVYTPTRSREETSGQMAEDLVSSVFRGSVSNLVMNLLGRQKVETDDIQRLRKILDDADNTSKAN